jgi:predicted XRE-type DNA-binding protein
MHSDYNHTIEAASDSPEQTELGKQRSELITQIHARIDFKTTPIKSAVDSLGVTPSQAKKLIKGETSNFSIFELNTFLKRLNDCF